MVLFITPSTMISVNKPDDKLVKQKSYITNISIQQPT